MVDGNPAQGGAAENMHDFSEDYERRQARARQRLSDCFYNTLTPGIILKNIVSYMHWLLINYLTFCTYIGWILITTDWATLQCKFHSLTHPDVCVKGV